MTRHVVFALVVAQPGRTFWATARLACGLQHRRPAKQASKAGPFLSYADGFARLRARCNYTIKEVSTDLEPSHFWLGVYIVGLTGRRRVDPLV